MFLSKPEIVKMLNSFFVPCFVDFVNTAQGSRKRYLALRTRLFERRREFNYRGGPQLWVVSPEGEPLVAFHVEDVELFPARVEATLQRLVAQLGRPPGSQLSRHVPRDLDAMARDDAALRVTSRFLLDEALASLDPRITPSFTCDVPAVPRLPPPSSKLFRIRLKSPIEEWCILSSAQEKVLLPPVGAVQGDAYSVPHEVAARIFRFMCPPTTNFNLSGRVLEAVLDGEVAVQTSDETRVRLRGRYACEHQLWHAPDRNVAEANVDGVLVFESASRTLTRFALVTDLALYGDRKGLRVPYVAAAELVPGLRGKRACRAELPPQLASEDERSNEHPEPEGGPAGLQGRQFEIHMPAMFEGRASWFRP